MKIGKTGGNSAQDVISRMKELDRTGVPRAFICEYAAVVENYEEVERALHTGFGENRVRPNREFFEGIAAFRIKAVLRLLEKQEVTPDSAAKVTQDEEETERPPRAENFKFPMARIPRGVTLEWTNDPKVTCEVADENNHVEYEGSRWTVSGLARHLLGRTSARGSLYWMYEGETLQERRERFEAEEADNDG